MGDDDRFESAASALVAGSASGLSGKNTFAHQPTLSGVEVDSVDQLEAAREEKKAPAPLWAWIALVVAVVACSSGGIWFALLNDCPAILRASWRLALTALLQVPGFVRDWRRSPPELLERYKSSTLVLFGAGAALAAHFSAWSISLTLTSLSHSLLFVCTTPILLVTHQAIGWVVLRKCLRTRFFEFPPTWIEVVGTLIGFGAAALLAEEAARMPTTNQSPFTTSLMKDPTLIGDLIATLGAATMGIYLMTGASLRKWLPVWLYVLPVTAISAILAAALSLLVEPGVVTYGFTNKSLLGFLGDGRRFGLVLGAAITSGILGHTIANLALEHISPLIVSVLLLNEPLIGSLLGYLVGVQAAPSLVTLVAGIPLMLAAGLVSLGGRDSDLYKAAQRRFDRLKNRKFQVVDESLQGPSSGQDFVVV